MIRPQHLIASALAFACLLWPVKPVHAQTTQPSAPTPWTPGTKLAAGTTYLLDGPVSVSVNAPNCKFKATQQAYGKGGSAISVRPGIIGTQVINIDFNAPDSETDLRACVHDEGIQTLVTGCTADRTGQFIDAWPTSDGLTVEFCRNTDRGVSGAVYCGGTRNTTVRYSRLTARNENTVRWSPQGPNVGTYALVEMCELRNTGSKAALDFRHVDYAKALNNRLWTRENNSCIAIGAYKDPVNEHGSSYVEVRGNECHDGSITVHAGARFVKVDRNLFVRDRLSSNAAITVNSAGGVLHDLSITNNVGRSPIPQNRLISYYRPLLPNGTFGPEIKPPGLIELGNAWELVSPPATQPTTRPIQ